MSDVAAILAARKPRRSSVRLLLDGDLAHRISELKRDIQRAKQREIANPQGLGSPVGALEQELAELAVQADEATVTFTFQAVSRTVIAELQRNHPPTAEQWERYREATRDVPVMVAMQQRPAECDWDGMAPELLAVCAVEPKMTVAEAQQLWDSLSDAEAAQLFDAAWKVNQQAALRPFSGTDTATTPSFGPSSTTAENGESPFLSLADGS